MFFSALTVRQDTNCWFLRFVKSTFTELYLLQKYFRRILKQGILVAEIAVGSFPRMKQQFGAVKQDRQQHAINLSVPVHRCKLKLQIKNVDADLTAPLCALLLTC